MIGERADSSDRSSEHLVYRADKDEIQFLAGRRCQIRKVTFILCRQQDLGDTGAESGEDLLLDPTHRQDIATEGDLTGHREIVADRTP